MPADSQPSLSVSEQLELELPPKDQKMRTSLIPDGALGSVKGCGHLGNRAPAKRKRKSFFILLKIAKEHVRPQTRVTQLLSTKPGWCAAVPASIALPASAALPPVLVMMANTTAGDTEGCCFMYSMTSGVPSRRTASRNRSRKNRPVEHAAPQTSRRTVRVVGCESLARQSGTNRRLLT